MPFVIFFILISLPVLEVASIVEVSRWVGPVATFLLLAAGVAFGGFLVRSQSLSVGRKMVAALETGALPEKMLLDSGMIAFAGVLFMIPGFISDIAAILILIPPTRRSIGNALAYSFRSRRKRRDPSGQPPDRRADPIDVEFTEAPKSEESARATR